MDLIKLKSNTLCNYYGKAPSEYEIKFIHYNIDVIEESNSEYANLEKDLKEIYDLNSEVFKLYFSNTDNFMKIITNTNIHYTDKMYLRIRNIDDYNRLKYSNVLKNIKLIIDIKDIEIFNITSCDLVLQLDNVCELPILKLNELLCKYRIKEILLGQISYISKDCGYLYDLMSKMYKLDSSRKFELEKISKITNDIYTIDEYMKIMEVFQKILKQLEIKTPIDGIYKIFHYIANVLYYDNGGIIQTKVKNQNLIGPVLNNIGVCEGYSKFLQQMLSLINVKSIVVQGGGSKEQGGHLWNQVHINGKWYNADVTSASYAIKNNKKIETFLVKDSDLVYKTNSSIAYKCEESFRYNEI